MITIEKEKRKKKAKQRTNIMLAFFAAAISYFVLHFFTIINTTPRADYAQAFSDSIPHGLMHPLTYQVTQAQATILILAAFMAAMLHVMSQIDREMRKHDNPDTVNGEAHFMNEEELAQFQTKYTEPFSSKNHDGYYNMILSKDIRLSLNGQKTRTNCNVLCIGGSGAGKSRFFAAPNILQYNSNFVITDPSGELLNDYGKALENVGYDILVFDIIDVYRSNRYNPFHYIREEKDVFTLVNTLIQNTTPPDSHVGDPIWENGEKLIISAIMLYLWHIAPPERQTFGSLIEMITMAQIDEQDPKAQSPLDILFAQLEEEEPSNLAVKQYKRFKLAAGKTAKSFLISVATRLNAFDLSDLTYLTSKDDMHFESFADSKKALFVIIPTGDKTFNFIVSLLYSQLFSTLYNYVETRVKYGYTGTS